MEQEPDFELQPSESLTSQEVVDALADVLEVEDIEFLNEQLVDTESPMDLDDVIGYVYGRLIENGEDPEETLKNLGVLENSD